MIVSTPNAPRISKTSFPLRRSARRRPPPDQPVVAIPAIEPVIAPAPQQLVVVPLAPYNIVPPPEIVIGQQHVIPRAELDDIVAAPTLDPVVAGASMDQVVPVTS